ncbi:MAG: serine hydrolase [Planctomycetota bacterium]|nr:serine hydrolase [Planctomycetota bacterium]
MTPNRDAENVSRRALVAVVGLALAGSASWASPEPAKFEWQTAAPESVGMSRAALDRLREELSRRKTKTLLVIRGERIVYEWYAQGYRRTTRHTTASLAKALVGGTTLALALGDGRLRPDDRAAKYVPAWRGEPGKSKITVRHLATHSSGIEDAESPGKSHGELTGWKGAFWKRSPDPFSIARDRAPLIFEPGTRFAYSNPGMAMLAYAVTASLREAPQRDLRSLLRERIMKPLGVPDDEWSVGYGRTYHVDGLPLVANWGGGGYSANAVARVGRLFLRRGDWQGRQLIPRETVELVLRDAGTPTPERVPPEGPFPRSGLGWYVNSDGVWRDVPRDAFAGAGAGNQVLIVVPSLDLIVVRGGGQLEAGNFWGGLETYLFNPVVRAIRPEEGPPCPPSPVIAGVRFEPPETIRRAARGSDNWPITWGDDGHLYTVYGDGWGFEPRTERKLSQGFARVEGPAEEFRGVNVRSPTGERAGDGPRGPKASGLLMVDGVLYAWVRNTSNATLAWSRDRARTWTWGLTLSTSFGCASFLNHGKNHAGARDDFVYTYSADGPSAYESYDGVVLARVRKSRITERSAYEFYAGPGERGSPRWARDIRERAPVFTDPGGCQRLDVVSHPGFGRDGRDGRYLMCLARDHAGSWGIYDAPEPWGPWTRVFFTRDWGLGETHGYRIPTKWIDRQSGVFTLVFSGRGENDAFCVRKCRLVPR